MSRNTGMFALAAIVSLFMAGLANGASTAINVDFNTSTSPTYSGTGAASDSGTFWNGVNVTSGSGTFTSTANSLNLSDGSTVATGVSFSLGTAGQSPAETYNLTSINTSPSTIAPNLFFEFVYDSTNNNTTFSTFAINGLQPGVPYDLYLYSMAEFAVAGNTLFTVNGVTTLVTGNPSTGSLGTSFVAATTGSIISPNNGNYVLYSHVLATGGTISGTWQGTNERFNGFQLVEAPEPASLGLLMVGGVMLLKRRRA